MGLKTASRGSLFVVELYWDIRSWQFFSFNTVMEAVVLR